MKLRVSIDDSRLRKRLAKLGKNVTASQFQVQLRRFTANTLNTCVQNTPIRSHALIKKNQTKQYRNRINYIPSVHTLEDPTLVVNEAREHWLFYEGNWYNAEWRLPDEAWNAYQQLLDERERRMRTNMQSFIAWRAQARFLYVRSWWQVGQSVGIPVSSTPQQAKISHSRHNPVKEPPRGYAQLRGGLQTLSYTIFNPFLEIPSRYKLFSGRRILAQATRASAPEYYKDLSRELKRLVRK